MTGCWELIIVMFNVVMFRTSTSALLPLKNMKFVLSGKMDKEKYQGKIEALGGSVSNTVTKEVIALISDKGKKLNLLPI